MEVWTSTGVAGPMGRGNPGSPTPSSHTPPQPALWNPCPLVHNALSPWRYVHLSPQGMTVEGRWKHLCLVQGLNVLLFISICLSEISPFIS